MTRSTTAAASSRSGARTQRAVAPPAEARPGGIPIWNLGDEGFAVAR